MEDKHYYFLLGHSGWAKRLVDIADFIKSKDVNTKFSGLTFGEPAFHDTKSISDNLFTDIRRYEDLYLVFKGISFSNNRLREIEAAYGSIWQYAYSDRQLITYNYDEKKSLYDLDRKTILNTLQGIFSYYERMVCEYGVNIFVVYSAGSSWAQIASAVAKRYHVKFYELTTIRIPDRMILAEGGKQSCYLRNANIVSESDYQCARNAISKLKDSYEKPVWLVPTSNQRAAVNFSKMINFVKSYFSDDPIPSPDPGSFKSPSSIRVKEWIKFKYRYSFRVNPKEKRCNGCKLILLTLHYEPEASLSVRGLYYTNQLSLVEDISKSLPFDCVLMVKEHPQMIGRRPRRFYKKLNRIPNVELIDYDKNSDSYVKKSSLVITVTGTAGIEQVLLGKHTLMLGSNFFSELFPNLHSMTGSIEELPNLIAELVNLDDVDDEIIVDRLAQLVSASVPISQSGIWGSGTDVDSSLVEVLANYFYSVDV